MSQSDPDPYDLPVLPDGAAPRIGVIGLGYVGLPLALAFARRFPVYGYDSDAARIAALEAGHDATGETNEAEIAQADGLVLGASAEGLAACNVLVVAVPTPVDGERRPDLGSLLAATDTAGEALRRGGVVIFESTVYPGVTEGVCAPRLAARSGLAYNADFFVGYSPERINPGDRLRRLPDIRKITSGSTPAAARFIDALYRTIVPAGTFPTTSIRVAEAAKVVENTQRDVNIALVNELATVLAALGLDTLEVLEAAGSKWNFLPFRPGLVGGHCVGVDAWYLTHAASEAGHPAPLVRAARAVNDGMAGHVVAQVALCMARKGLALPGARVLVLGFAFKEACPDIRNTRVADVVRTLAAAQARVDIHDPWVDPVLAREQFGLDLLGEVPAASTYDAIVLAVAHPEFAAWGCDRLHSFGKPVHVLYDVKSVLPRSCSDGRL